MSQVCEMVSHRSLESRLLISNVFSWCVSSGLLGPRPGTHCLPRWAAYSLSIPGWLSPEQAGNLGSRWHCVSFPAPHLVSHGPTCPAGQPGAGACTCQQPPAAIPLPQAAACECTVQPQSSWEPWLRGQLASPSPAPSKTLRSLSPAPCCLSPWRSGDPGCTAQGRAWILVPSRLADSHTQPSQAPGSLSTGSSLQPQDLGCQGLPCSGHA